MSKIGGVCAMVIVGVAAVAAGSGLPPEVADRLENAVSFDDTNDFTGSYRISISTLVQKPNGKSREESLIEAEVVKNRDGETRRLLRFIEDGTDVTEKKREKFEARDGDREDNEGDDLADPFGDAADRFLFGGVETRGSTKVLAFEPAPGYEDDDDMARGAIAWDAESHEPRWLEMEAIDPPMPLKELRLRMDFQQIGDQLFVSKIVTDGFVKILLLKREFHMEIRFDDIRPAAERAESAD